MMRLLAATILMGMVCMPQARVGLLSPLEIHHAPEHGHEGHEEPSHAEHMDEHVSNHVEHGAKPQHSGVNGDCPGNQSANSVAVGLMAGVILMPLLVYMTMTKAAGGAVSDLTFRMIDLSTSIFLAVLWFSASADIFEHPAVKKLFPHAEEAFALLQVFLLYGLTMFIAYTFRHNKYYLLTFCGCAGHYIAFAAIKATGENQHAFGEGLSEEHSVFASFGFCLIVLAVLITLSLICFFTWRRYVKDEELHMAVEELELDIVGLVLSFAIMQAFRHALTGQYPAEAHLFLQQHDAVGIDIVNSLGTVSRCDEDQGNHGHHTATQRAIMLIFSISLMIFAMISLKYLEEFKQRGRYWTHKAVHVVQIVLVMCVAWGYLLWGEWQFYETYFRGDKMFGKMAFAVIASFVGMSLITGLAFATYERSSNAKGYASLVVMAISLVVAWSWEHCFHTAIDVVSKQYQVGYGGLVPKLIIAISIPLIILPGYIIFLKPIAVKADEKAHAEEEETMHLLLSEVLVTSPEPSSKADDTAFSFGPTAGSGAPVSP